MARDVLILLERSKEEFDLCLLILFVLVESVCLEVHVSIGGGEEDDIWLSVISGCSSSSAKG